MSLPVNFVRNVPSIRRIINNFNFHETTESAVNIDYLIERLKIDIKVEPFQDQWLNGYSVRAGLPYVRPTMFINQDKSLPLQRQTKGHELGHMLCHYKELPLWSHTGQEDKLLEREANYYSSYFLLPARTIYLAKRWRVGKRELAERMGVPIVLTDYRDEIFYGMKEYQAFL